jgi:hypothetical protein
LAARPLVLESQLPLTLPSNFFLIGWMAKNRWSRLTAAYNGYSQKNSISHFVPKTATVGLPFVFFFVGFSLMSCFSEPFLNTALKIANVPLQLVNGESQREKMFQLTR